MNEHRFSFEHRFMPDQHGGVCLALGIDFVQVDLTFLVLYVVVVVRRCI